MAYQYPFTCPHCLTEKAAFYFIGYQNNNENNSRITTFWGCPVCFEGICANMKNEALSYIHQGHALNAAHIIKTYPVPKALDAPEGTPPKVNHYYRQGMSNMRPGHYDAALSMFRTAMQVACRDEMKDAGATLYANIENLATKGVITKDMKDWAHATRLAANNPSHGDDPVTAEEAEDVSEFCRAFMIYAFTLPAIIVRRKKTV